MNISATLRSPLELLDQLGSDVIGKGPGTSLAAQVKLILAASNKVAAACGGLRAFTSLVNAQSQKTISASDAASFTTLAGNIEAVLGC